MALTIDLSDTRLYNDVYVPIITDRNPYILMYGGRDSAKSYTAAQKVIYHVLSEKYCKVVCIREVYADIKDSQFATLVDVIQTWGLEDYFYYTVSPLRIVCKLNGNIIIARGLDKPHKLKSLKDPTIAWIEEANETSHDSFIKIDTSLRSKYSDVLIQMILTFNPENEENWVPEEFFPAKDTYEREGGDFHFVKSPRSDTTILHTTYKDNRFCNAVRAAKYEQLARLADRNYFKVYCLGLWGNALKGLVFSNVKYVDEMPAIEHCKIHGYGLDFGFTNDPTGIVECALAHGELWFKEHCYRTGLVNTKSDKCPDQKSIEGEFERIGVTSETVVADSAEPKSIQELKNAGFFIIGVEKGKDSIESGIALMKKYPINIIGPNLKKEIRSYKYAEDKDGNTTNKPIDAWNHLIDPARYWVMQHLGANGEPNLWVL